MLPLCKAVMLIILCQRCVLANILLGIANYSPCDKANDNVVGGGGKEGANVRRWLPCVTLILPTPKALLRAVIPQGMTFLYLLNIIHWNLVKVSF